MAATELLAIGTKAADSSDLVVTGGSPATVGVKGTVDANTKVLITLKDDGGAYWLVGELNSLQRAAVLTGAGTYRFSRVGGNCGVYSA